VTAGIPFTITVTAVAGGSLDRIFNNDIHFTSSDKTAVLPADYTFNAGDAGSHLFVGGITLMSIGDQRITATVPVAHSITGTVNVIVSTAATTP